MEPMTFTATLLSADARPRAVAEISALVAEEMDRASGISGMVLKTGFKAAQKLGPDVVRKAVNAVLPDMARTLEPRWEARTGSFGQALAADGERVADELLAVVDRRVAEQPAFAAIYKGMRGKARGFVVAALPRLGEVLEGLVTSR